LHKYANMLWYLDKYFWSFKLAKNTFLNAKHYLKFLGQFWFHINPGNSKYAKFGNNRGQKFFLCCKKMWLVYGNMDSVSIGTWSLGVLPILCTCFTLHFTVVCLDWNLESLVFIFKPWTHFFKSFFKIFKFLHDTFC